MNSQTHGELLLSAPPVRREMKRRMHRVQLYICVLILIDAHIFQHTINAVCLKYAHSMRCTAIIINAHLHACSAGCGAFSMRRIHSKINRHIGTHGGRRRCSRARGRQRDSFCESDERSEEIKGVEADGMRFDSKKNAVSIA